MTDQSSPQTEDAADQLFDGVLPIMPLAQFGGDRELYVAVNLVHLYGHLAADVCRDPMDSFPVKLGPRLYQLADDMKRLADKLAVFFGETASTADIKEVNRVGVDTGYVYGTYFALRAGIAHDFDEDHHVHDPADDDHEDHLRADDDGMPPPPPRRRNSGETLN